jgi:hypothetical protein
MKTVLTKLSDAFAAGKSEMVIGLATKDETGPDLQNASKGEYATCLLQTGDTGA